MWRGCLAFGDPEVPLAFLFLAGGHACAQAPKCSFHKSVVLSAGMRALSVCSMSRSLGLGAAGIHCVDEPCAWRSPRDNKQTPQFVVLIAGCGAEQEVTAWQCTARFWPVRFDTLFFTRFLQALCCRCDFICVTSLLHL